MAHEPQTRAKAVTLLGKGKSISEVAELTGVSQPTLRKWRDETAMPLAMDPPPAADPVMTFLRGSMAVVEVAPTGAALAIAWLMGRASARG